MQHVSDLSFLVDTHVHPFNNIVCKVTKPGSMVITSIKCKLLTFEVQRENTRSSRTPDETLHFHASNITSFSMEFSYVGTMRIALM